MERGNNPLDKHGNEILFEGELYIQRTRRTYYHYAMLSIVGVVCLCCPLLYIFILYKMYVSKWRAYFTRNGIFYTRPPCDLLYIFECSENHCRYFYPCLHNIQYIPIENITDIYVQQTTDSWVEVRVIPESDDACGVLCFGCCQYEDYYLIGPMFNRDEFVATVKKELAIRKGTQDTGSTQQVTAM